jgi:hypothetical protein
MINTIRTFFARIRQTLFERRLEAEIYGQLFPHLERERNFCYPFDSDEGLQKQVRKEKTDAYSHLKMIDQECAAMPKAYGEAFRYIAYRDLSHRMALYRQLARRRVQPKTCDPRFVAIRA